MLRDAGVQLLSKVPPSGRLALLRARGDPPWEDGAEFTTPALDPGETSGAPGVMGIGGQKPEMAHR